MLKFPKIPNYNQALARIAYKRRTAPAARYLHLKGTVKLHGTNAGVAKLRDGSLQAQSRNRVLSLTEDNIFGWAAFVERYKETLAPLIPVGHTLFGELIGPGVQKGAIAVGKLPAKQFVIFALVNNATEGFQALPRLFRAPFEIQTIDRVPPVHLTVDCWDLDSVREANTEIETLTAFYEKSCPWAEAMGIESGLGEGLVWSDAETRVPLFKSKGQAHREVPARVKPAPIDASVALRFCEDYVTPARLSKGLDYLREIGRPIDRVSTGEFLRWVAHDLAEEQGSEIAALGGWKGLQREVSNKARGFFLVACADEC